MLGQFAEMYAQQLRSGRWRKIRYMLVEPAGNGRSAIGVMMETLIQAGRVKGYEDQSTDMYPGWLAHYSWSWIAESGIAIAGVQKWEYKTLLSANDNTPLTLHMMADLVELMSDDRC